MVDLKTLKIGGEGWIMCSFMIDTACQILGYQRTEAKWVMECGMHGSEGNLEQNFDWKM
jgi:hypothetical protein